MGSRGSFVIHSLKEIATAGRAFRGTSDDKFFLVFEFAMSKKYVDDLSDNVRRGIRKKLALGWFPHRPPLGFENDPKTHTIVKDEAVFPIIRRIFDLVLAHVPVPEAQRIANDVWGYRSPVHGRNGGTPLARSTIYRMLGNPFYHGLIVMGGDVYPGKHEPIVTKEEFDQVQRILRRDGRAHNTRHDFALTGCIRCGTCNAIVTASEHRNRFGSLYHYYHCSKRPRSVRCDEPHVRADALESQALDFLERIFVPDDYLAWAIRHLDEVAAAEGVSRAGDDGRRRAAIAAAERQVENLTRMSLRDLVSDEEYVREKTRLLGEVESLRRAEAENGLTWFEPAKTVLSFANQAKKRFPHAESWEKRFILQAVGLNPTLHDKKLVIHAKKPFSILEERPLSPTKSG